VDRETFTRRFREAAARALEVARGCVEEELPDRMRFRLQLNAADDDEPLDERERVYPEDSSFERRQALADSDEESVVATLWRDGAVPESMDLRVSGRTDELTWVTVRSFSRFTASEDLFHQGDREKQEPFFVRAPSPPEKHPQGLRFSIYHRPHCWTRADLQHVLSHADRVFFLSLWGAAFFDDAVVLDLPTLPALGVLGLYGCGVGGAGLSRLDRHPGLRSLRIQVGAGRQLDLRSLPPLPSLWAFEASDLPETPWGFEVLATRTPRPWALWLSGRGHIMARGPCPPSLRLLSIRAHSISVEMTLPPTLTDLFLDLPGLGGTELERWLTPLGTLRALSLRRMSVNESLVRRMLARFPLEDLDVTGTPLTSEALARIAHDHPDLRLLPGFVTKRR
jgi:hypothetical protein